MTLLDTSAAIDLLTRSSPWHAWATDVAAQADASGGGLLINHIVLAELQAGPQPVQVLAAISDAGLIVAPLTDAVAIRAGAAQRLYRQRGGPRSAIITDFLIGAHASVLGVPLITRDRQRFASYFPEVELVAPEEPE